MYNGYARVDMYLFIYFFLYSLFVLFFSSLFLIIIIIVLTTGRRNVCLRLRSEINIRMQSAIVPHLHCHNPIDYSERRSGDIDLLMFLSFSLDPLAGHRIHSRRGPCVRVGTFRPGVNEPTTANDLYTAFRYRNSSYTQEAHVFGQRTPKNGGVRNLLKRDARLVPRQIRLNENGTSTKLYSIKCISIVSIVQQFDLLFGRARHWYRANIVLLHTSVYKRYFVGHG